MNYTIRIAKTKALISFAVTAKLICVFVFAYAKSRFSHDAAPIMSLQLPLQGLTVRVYSRSLLTYPVQYEPRY